MGTAAEHYDALETRDPSEREAALLAALPTQVRAAQATAAFAERLTDIDAGGITTRAALARLPVTRKHELLARQQAARERAPGDSRSAHADPFGGFAAIGWRGIGIARPARRVFQSPGPIYEPEGHAVDYWRMARALFAAGIRAGHLLHNSFSYHLTPAGSITETGAQALGCTVFPGGVGNTELQLQALCDLGADAYAGTPSFLRILLEKAVEARLPLPHLKHALVSGEAFPSSLRDSFIQLGVDAYQVYATADVGCIAYETAAREGLVLSEDVIVEIVRPGTDDPVPEPVPGQPAEVGEVVVTALNLDYPLIRFGTGDLSAVLPGSCPTGRSNARICGWLGRADQTAKVRGMFVHPAQVAQVLRKHPEIGRARLIVEGEMANDRMTLHIECEGRPEGLVQAVAQSLRDITKLRGDVQLHALNTLPNDGRVIEDTRRLD